MVYRLLWIVSADITEMSHMHSLADKYEGKLVHKLKGVILYVINEDISLFWGVAWQEKISYPTPSC